MHGRVTRLFVAPLIRAMQAVVGPSPVLAYLDSFRYPLSGEFAMTADLARVTNVPADWGLEIGMLMEVYNNCELAGICQTELCDRYDHKHQGLRRSRLRDRVAEDVRRHREIAVDDAGRGRYRCDRRRLARTGHGVSPRGDGDGRALLRRRGDQRPDLRARWRRSPGVGVCRRARRRPANATSLVSHETPLLSGWAHVASALPDFGEWLLEAVEQDAGLKVGVSCGTG